MGYKEDFLATMDPTTQGIVGGQKNLDAWYDAAMKAGAVPQQFQPGGVKAGQPQAPQQQPIGGGQRSDFDAFYQSYTGGQVDPRSQTGYLSPEGQREQYRAWEQFRDPSCPPNAPYRSEREGAGSACVEVPTNCPPGMVNVGMGCRPAGPGQGGGQGPSGPGGAGQAGGPDPNLIAALKAAGFQGSNPNEIMQSAFAQLNKSRQQGQQNISDLMGIYRGELGMDPGQQKQGYANFEASQANAISSKFDQARENILSTLPPGGQRDEAIARLEGERASQLGLNKQAGIQSAQQGLTGLSQLYMQDPAALQLAMGGLGGTTAWRGQDIQSMLGMRGQDISRMLGQGQLGLGYAQLAERGSEFGQNLTFEQQQAAQKAKEFGLQFGFQTGPQFDWLKQYQQQQLDIERQRNEEQSQGGLFNTIGGVLGSVFSDEKVKENVKPFTRGLSDLLTLEPKSFTYNGKGGTTKGEKGASVIAQSMKKSIPEGVTKVKTKDGDMHAISPMHLLMTTINAVKELHAKMPKAKVVDQPTAGKGVR